MVKSSQILAVLLCLGWTAVQASLPDGTWTNAFSGDFNDGTRWLNGNVPISSDDVVFNLAPTITSVVTIMSDQTINNLDIIDTNVMFDLINSSSELKTLPVTNDTDLALNASHIATLTLLNGTLKTTNLNSGVSGTS